MFSLRGKNMTPNPQLFKKWVILQQAPAALRTTAPFR
jgi:hypothetical protein